MEFGRVLIKNGDEFKIGDCFICKYEKIQFKINTVK